MRSKALPPARAQGHIVPFLEAAALFAALCIFARTAALMLAAAITAPLPMAETLFLAGAAVRTGAARIICAGGSRTGQHTGSGGILSAAGRAGADREH